MTALQGTGEHGEAEGAASNDHDTDFQQFMTSNGAQATLIEKLKKNNMDSIEMLQEVNPHDTQELKAWEKDLQLTKPEFTRFKSILKKVPRENKQTLNNVIYPEERKAILSMEQKLKRIQQSLTDIEHARKQIPTEVERCTQCITSTFDEILKQVAYRKQQLLQEMNTVANAELTRFEQLYEETRQNSVLASSNIDSCYLAISKDTDLAAIEQRKENILSLAKAVDEMKVFGGISSSQNGYQIPFSCDSQAAIGVIQKCGHFDSVPVPVLVSVTRTLEDQVKLQWRLENVDQATRRKINKLRVEWMCDTEIKHDGDDTPGEGDCELDYDAFKVFELSKVRNQGNEVNIGKFENRNYLFRVKCMMDDVKVSNGSNLKQLSKRSGLFDGFDSD